LQPGGSLSATDVVWTWTTNNKGTLIIKYDGSNSPPLVTTRVYFAPKSAPAQAYSAGLPAYDLDGTGTIRPHTFNSEGLNAPPSALKWVVVNSPPAGIGPESTTATMGAITVNMTGTGTGTVTSGPPGITCPGTCSGNFSAGSSVALNGQAAPGSVFVSITGC